jgi:hypothetical protein
MRKTTLFILLDALGYELIEQTGFLAGLAPHRYRLRTVLGSSTATIPTLLTGCAPFEHGRWMPYSYSPDDSPFRQFHFLRHLPRAIANSPRIRARLARIIARRLHWANDLDLLNVPLELLSVLDYAAKRHPFEPGGLSPVSSAIDRLHHERIPSFFSDPHATDAENFQHAREALQGRQAAFALIHATELCPVLRRHGLRGEAARDQLAWYEAQIRTLHQIAAQDGAAVRIYLGTDRGMTEVAQAVDLISKVHAAGVVPGRDYFAFYETTMARFWFADAHARHAVMGSLADVTHGRWLADDQLRIEGVYFHDHRYGQAIFLLEPGLVIAPSYQTAEAPAAADGYRPDHPGSWAAFCANILLDIPPRLIGDLCALILEGARWTVG